MDPPPKKILTPKPHILDSNWLVVVGGAKRPRGAAHLGPRGGHMFFEGPRTLDLEGQLSYCFL